MTYDAPVTPVIIEDMVSPTPNVIPSRMALFDTSGNPISRILDDVPSGAEVILTGFASGSAGAVAATDTVNEAIAKVQARTLSAAPTGANVVLTGYAAGSAGAVAATDSVNAAVAKLEARTLSAAPTGANVVLTGFVAGSAGAVAATDSVNEAIAKVQATSAPLLQNVNAVAESGVAVTIPAPSTATMNHVTLTDNCTFTFPTATAGRSFTLALKQDATGSRTVTWPAAVKWAGGTTPTLTTTAAAVDRFKFQCDDGATWAGSTIGLDMK